MNSPLVRRLHSELRQLVAEEREGLVLFLHKLEELDREHGHLVLGYGSLWDYLLRGLGLRESAAGRRIAAMKLLRRFPQLEAPLADGRLCITTLDILSPLLDAGDVDDIVRQASHLSKRETLELAARLNPRAPPREGIRSLPTPPPAPASPPPAAPGALGSLVPAPAAAATAPPVAPTSLLPLTRPRSEVTPCNAEEASMRVTVDRPFLDRLDRAKALASHKFPKGDNYSVLFEALGVYVAFLEKRKGLAAPSRRRTPAPEPTPTPGVRAPIPAHVRRAVMERDGWSCAYVSEDGRRCGSSWKLELHHRTPAAVTGTSRVEDLEVRCQPHNGLHAREDYGDQLIDLVVRANRR